MKIDYKNKMMRGAFMRNRRTTKRNLFVYINKIHRTKLFASVKKHTEWWRKSYYNEYTN